MGISDDIEGQHSSPLLCSRVNCILWSFFQPYKNVKDIVYLQAIQKGMGCSLLKPVWEWDNYHVQHRTLENAKQSLALEAWSHLPQTQPFLSFLHWVHVSPPPIILPHTFKVTSTQAWNVMGLERRCVYYIYSLCNRHLQQPSLPVYSE